MIDKETFDKLTPAERRVAIAKDVIARLESGRMEEQAEQFIMWSDISVSDPAVPFSCPLQEFLNTEKCSVCAKGGIFVSWIGNFNEFDFDDLKRVGNTDFNGARLPNGLTDAFSIPCLDFIETLFENAAFAWTDGWAREEHGKLTHDMRDCFYGNLYLIMDHIVRNKGEITAETIAKEFP